MATLIMVLFFIHLHCVLKLIPYLVPDIKPSNILFNYKAGYQQDAPETESRLADIRLADFGNCVRINSKHARGGRNIGTPIFRSP
jgi:serine/threonine protein kinase